jgi:NADH-quinone oxidoreductase subunit M
MTHLLSILLLLPATGALAVLCLPNARAIRWTALGTTLLVFVFSLVLILPIDRHIATVYADAAHRGTMRFVERRELLRSLHFFWRLGIDGLSLPLILLTTFIFPLACAASWKLEKSRKGYFALFLSSEAAILGVFCSLDLVLFFLFLQIVVAEVCLLLRIWSGLSRRSAAGKLFLRMMAGSVALLIVLAVIFVNAHSFDMTELPSLLSANFAYEKPHWHQEMLLFLLLVFAVCISTAAVPLHTWLLHAVAQAPAALNMVIVALLLPIGSYALFRIAYPFFPDAARHLWLLVALIGIVSILYGALCALVQTDLKRLLAYSSISQMGFISLGTSVMTPAAFRGTLFMIIAHGIASAMMFFSAGVLTDRAGHQDLARFGGLASTMPRFWGLSAVGFFATIGIPGLCGFVGEILILLGLFQALRPDALLFATGVVLRGKILTLAILAMLGLILTAGYMLLTLQRIFFGPERPEQKEFSEIDQRETVVLAGLAGAAILLGILPNVLVFSMTGKTIDAMFGVFDNAAFAAHPPSDSSPSR